jgi:lipoprotein-anchoring transpeptidase ErfK/SrfK
MSAVKLPLRACTAALSAAFVIILATAASSQSFSDNSFDHDNAALHQAVPQTEQPGAVPADDDLPAPLRRQTVSYLGDEPPGTVIIDTAHTFLYLTLGGGKALRYGIGVGRQGFTWSGVETVSRKSEWPDWIPPAEMIARQPYLPRWVGGGPGNPLGARALYLGNTDYRIHGTNNPASIGKHVSSGCIRMRDADVIDLYERVAIGAKVVVLPNDPRSVAINDRQINDRQDVSIERNRAGGMTATVLVGPATPASADSRRPRAEWSGNPTPLGLY